MASENKRYVPRSFPGPWEVALPNSHFYFLVYFKPGSVDQFQIQAASFIDQLNQIRCQAGEFAVFVEDCIR